MPTPIQRRMLLLATLAAGLVVLALTLAVGGIQDFHPRPGAANARLPVLWPVPSFRLVDQEGQIRTSESLRGSVWIADFIFTSCRSICPVLSARMVQLQRAIGDPRLRFVSFSVDPERDTPEALRAYATRWAPDERRWMLLATTSQSLAALTKGMKTFVEQQGDPDATIHTSQLYLIDAQGQVQGLYGTEGDAFAQLAPDARRLLSELGEAPRPEGVAASAVTESGAGGALYREAGCAGCHDVASIAPSLAGIAGRTATLSDGGTVVADGAYLRESILDPAARIVASYPPTMPSYRGTLSDAQVTELVHYLQTWRADPRTDAPTTVGSAAVAVDPVCGMQVHVGPGTPHATHLGSTEYFCSEHCRARFLDSLR